MIAIHINPTIENQVNYGNALHLGFKAHGIKSNLTTKVDATGETHCIIGPWYAYNHYKTHKNVIYLDRACWDHPNYTSINWMTNGQKVWNWGIQKPARYHPPTKPWKEGKRLIVLCDYGEDGSQYANMARPHYEYSIRRHPSDIEPENLLIDELAGFDMAIGGKTTALVTAAIEGLPIFCTDKLSPVSPIGSPLNYASKPDRGNWLKDLSWYNWTKKEIESGEAWAFLQSYGKLIS